MQLLHRVQGDEEQHIDQLRRDDSDALTFADAGLAATPDSSLGFGQPHCTDRVSRPSSSHYRTRVRR